MFFDRTHDLNAMFVGAKNKTYLLDLYDLSVASLPDIPEDKMHVLRLRHH